MKTSLKNERLVYTPEWFEKIRPISFNACLKNINIVIFYLFLWAHGREL